MLPAINMFVSLVDVNADDPDLLDFLLLFFRRYYPSENAVQGCPARARSKEADIHDWMFITRVAFCVETDGTVSDVETFRGTGLPGLDRLARASVATWQFRPYTVQGVPTRICSQCVRST